MSYTILTDKDFRGFIVSAYDFDLGHKTTHKVEIPVSHWVGRPADMAAEIVTALHKAFTSFQSKPTEVYAVLASAGHGTVNAPLFWRWARGRIWWETCSGSAVLAYECDAPNS